MSSHYLYGIIGIKDDANLSVAGVDGVSPVYTVAHEGIGCVVSNDKGEEVGALPKEILVRRLLAHQQVVEHVMREHTVLPVKFGTILDNSQEVLALLSQGYADFVEALAFLQDKVEIEVAATWDIGRVLQELSQETEVVHAREAITRRGQPSLAEQIHLGQLVKGCMDRRRSSYRQRMVSFLQPLAIDVARNALVSDELVMNVAFLVDRARQHEFDERIWQLDALFQNEITFRVIGPLPPYSFHTVQITQLTPEQMEEARQTLCLQGAISEAEVRQAYRRLAAEEQRHLSPEDAQAQARFTRLRQAADLLLQYCKGHHEARIGGQSPSLIDRDRARTLLIAIKGSRDEEIEPARFGKGERM